MSVQTCVVVIVHGYAEHSGRYQHVGEALVARGYAVETLDLRGHGRSEGNRSIVRSFDQFLDNRQPLSDTITGWLAERHL